MPYSVTKEFTFSAAHFLTNYHGKCENLHGHNYRLQVTVAAPLQADDMVIDFAIVKQLVKTHVLDLVDHTNLNDRLPNPSCERVAEWIFQTLKPHLAISSITLFETDTAWVTYTE